MNYSFYLSVRSAVTMGSAEIRRLVLEALPRVSELLDNEEGWDGTCVSFQQLSGALVTLGLGDVDTSDLEPLFEEEGGGELELDLLKRMLSPTINTTKAAPPTLPKPSSYERPKPAWLLRALAAEEAQIAHDQSTERLGLPPSMLPSNASSIAYLPRSSVHASAESGVTTASSVSSMPRIARMPKQVEAVTHRRVSKQEVVPLPAVRADRVKALAGALNLSPRLLGKDVAKAHMILAATPAALRNGAVEISSARRPPRPDELSPRHTRPSVRSGALTERPAAKDATAKDVSQPRVLSADELPAALRSRLASNLLRVIDLFRDADTNADGKLSLEELIVAVRKAGLDASDEDVTALFATLDLDHDGTLTFDELNASLRKVVGAPASSSTHSAPKSFAAGGGMARALASRDTLSGEAQAVVEGLAQIQLLIDEHEQLRHALRFGGSGLTLTLTLALALTPHPDGGSTQGGPGSTAHATAASPPLTFGDMVADQAGFDQAVKEAVEANVKAVGEQEEEHYHRAAELLRSLPKLAQRPIRIAAEMQLHLTYYYEMRMQSELPFRTKRASTLRALASDCAPYKNAVLSKSPTGKLF